MRRRVFSTIISSMAVSISLAMAVSFPVYAEKMPLPHLIQTVTEQDIYEGMLALGYLETPTLETEDCGKAYENVKNSVVRIQMGTAFGSGIIWELLPEKIVIATNKHVLEHWNEEDSFVHFTQGFDVDAKVLGTSKTCDVGFVSVDCGQLTYGELQKVRYVCADESVYENLVQGTEMFLVDIGSMENEEQYYVGTVEEPHKYIADFDAHMLYGYGFAKPGMSGSGIYDGRGFLIGMTTGGTMRNETAGVPLPDIMEAYEEVLRNTALE